MDKYTLHLGDCLEYMRGMDAGSVDAVITDPPYGDKTHSGARTSNGSLNKNNYGKVEIINKIDFHSISIEFIKEIFYLSHSKKWVISFMDWRYMLELENNPPDNLEFIRFGIWHKTQYAPQFTGDRPAAGWEAIAIMHPPGIKKWNGGGRSAVWSSAVEHHSEHKTAKPLPLIRKLVSEFSDENDLIFDPFMGSGTTGVACMQLGRRFIGCEIDPGYFAIAERRIKAAAAQMLLPFGEDK